MEEKEGVTDMILAVLQARVSSSRLPGKVIRSILGKPMLARQIERILRAQRIDKLIVATSTEFEDDAVDNLCSEIGIECFRGSLNDVLDRFYQAAKPYNPQHVVRLTGDCPLADPEIIDRLIKFHLAGDYDYSSNALEPTYPDGLDAEVMRFSALEQTWREADNIASREHVTLFLYQHPQLFKIGIERNLVNLSHLRWTVDELVDFELVEKIYQQLYSHNPNFSVQEILSFLKECPELKTMNTDFKRNEGLTKSLCNKS